MSHLFTGTVSANATARLDEVSTEEAVRQTGCQRTGNDEEEGVVDHSIVGGMEIVVRRGRQVRPPACRGRRLGGSVPRVSA